MVSLVSGPTRVVVITADGGEVHSLTVDGRDVTDYGVRVDSATGVVIEDLVILAVDEVAVLGLNSEVEARHVTIADIGRPASTHADGFQFHPDLGPTCALSVTSSDIRDLFGSGIKAGDCAAQVADTRIAGTGESGIRIEAPTHDRPVTIRGCEVSDTLGFGMLVGPTIAASHLLAPTVSRSVVSGVRHDASSEYNVGISVQTSGDHATLDLNHVHDLGDGVAGIHVNAPSMSLESNRVEVTGDLGILLVGGDGETLVGHNTLQSTTLGGIYVEAPSSLEIEHNAISGLLASSVGVRHAIVVEGAGDTAIHHNNVDVEGDGILANDTSGVLVARLNLIRATLAGLAVTGAGPGSRIESNRILEAAMGLHAGQADELRVTMNRLGPLSSTWHDWGLEVGAGLILGDLDDAEVMQNLIAVADAAHDVCYGIEMLDAGGLVGANRVSGGATVGIGYRWGYTDRLVDLTVQENSIVDARGVGISVHQGRAGSSFAITGNTVSGTRSDTWYDGNTYGDGICILISDPLAAIDLSGNTLTGNARSGIFAAAAPFSASSNTITQNAISLAWQDGADALVGENTVECNGSDQPLVDQGMSVPDPPSLVMPGG
jgi:nitrous oxidase accessory protein NosD